MPVLEDPVSHLSHTNRFLRGNFAPVTVETTAFDLPVKGKIPEELEGRLLRIGPNPMGMPQEEHYHWFTGTGMAHGLRLRSGKAEWYRNRFVVDGLNASALGRPDLLGPRNGDGKNVANTNILDMGGRTYAIAEAGGLPVELTYTLESVARSNLGGTLEHGFVAHPKLDPSTGQLLAVSYEARLEALTYMVVDPDGRAEVRASIPAPHRPMVHDMAFTPTWVIVLDLPVTFNPARMSTGLPYAWNPERPSRLGLLPRNGDAKQMRWVEAPSCYVFHVMNAFDDGNAVVMDVVRHPRTLDKEHYGPGEGLSKLVRWRISLLTGKLTETVLEERGCEFPRFNDEFGGKEYRFGYTAATDEEFQFGPAFKHDVSTGRTEVHDYGPGCATLEPVFIARKGAIEEDDGWVMSYVYNAERNASDVVILDAKAFSEEPVASISLPVRVPFGFHGNWVPDHI